MSSSSGQYCRILLASFSSSHSSNGVRGSTFACSSAHRTHPAYPMLLAQIFYLTGLLKASAAVFRDVHMLHDSLHTQEAVCARTLH
jgi:hypothetical protein